MAGRASVELKGAELGLDLAGRPDAVSTVVGTVKEREAQGWSFEAADASLELLMRSALGDEAVLSFAVDSYRVLIENRGGEVVSEATVKLVVDGERIIATREGNGPVNALDAALRAALTPSRPWLAGVELSDFKVRLLAGETRGTDAVTRVLVESTDGAGSWTTVGVHGNVVEASWLALVDAVAYAGLRQGALSGLAVVSGARAAPARPRSR
jgi:2-isopropylmalate synthase